jgi:hypothetical protein
LANGAVAAVKKGCELYKEIKGAAGDVKEVLDDLKIQFAKIQNPSNAQKIKYNEEVQRVQEIAKTDPNDTITIIGDHLGKFFDAYDQIEHLFWEQEQQAHEVYTGQDSVSKRALQRVLIRTRLEQMQSDIREEMIYRTPPELKDLWTRFEKMRQQVLKEQTEAKQEQYKKMQIAKANRRRAISKMKDDALWCGAILFVVAWYIGILVLIRTSQTYRMLYSLPSWSCVLC